MEPDGKDKHELGISLSSPCLVALCANRRAPRVTIHLYTSSWKSTLHDSIVWHSFGNLQDSVFPLFMVSVPGQLYPQTAPEFRTSCVATWASSSCCKHPSDERD